MLTALFASACSPGLSGAGAGDATGGAAVNAGGVVGTIGSSRGGGAAGTAVGGGGRPSDPNQIGTGGAAPAASSGGAASKSSGGAGGVASPAPGTTTTLPPLVPEFTEDFEDGSFTAPPVKWLFTVRSSSDAAEWAVATDGTKVASQSLAADETELVSGDYRWKDSSIEARLKLITPDARAGVCVRWKSVNDKYCVYLEQLVSTAGVVGWTMEMRMRSTMGSPGSLPKIKSKDFPTAISVSLAGWNTVKLEVHGTQYTASLNGTMVFQFIDPANLVDSGGIALATNNGGIAEFDDAHAVPF